MHPSCLTCLTSIFQMCGANVLKLSNIKQVNLTEQVFKLIILKIGALNQFEGIKKYPHAVSPNSRKIIYLSNHNVATAGTLCIKLNYYVMQLDVVLYTTWTQVAIQVFSGSFYRQNVLKPHFSGQKTLKLTQNVNEAEKIPVTMGDYWIWLGYNANQKLVFCQIR